MKANLTQLYRSISYSTSLIDTALEILSSPLYEKKTVFLDSTEEFTSHQFQRIQ